MKAIVFNKNLARYGVQKLLGARRAGRLISFPGLRSVSLEDVVEPKLPGPGWVRIRPRVSGICGSDLSVICAKGSPYFSPLTSTPFVFGHEVVGVVEQVGDGVRAWESAMGKQSIAVGDRVVLEPALGCQVRGIDPMCAACRDGRIALCRNITRGDISAGIQTGYCRDTGGAWSEQFVAHRSQIYAVPDGLADELAVLAEPFACALHGVGRVWPIRAETVCVLGCGSVGLLTIAALRARGYEGRIAAVAKYEHQKEFAVRLGANELLPPVPRKAAAGAYRRWADVLDAELHDPEMGKPTVIGGAAVMFDCIGSSQSIDDAIRFTAGGGDMVLVGMPGVASNVDWTALWYKEIAVHAAYAYGLVDGVCGSAKEARRAGCDESTVKHTIELAIEVLEQSGDRFEGFVSEPFSLDEYRRAIATALNTGRHRAIKCVFRIGD